MVSEKSTTGFEPASSCVPVQIKILSNAKPTRPLGTWRINGVKYTWICEIKPYSKNVV